MNVSVAIACLNEGPDLEATIALLAAGKTLEQVLDDKFDPDSAPIATFLLAVVIESRANAPIAVFKPAVVDDTNEL